MDDSTLKPRVNVFKGQIASDDNAIDIDPFSNDSNVTSIDLATFDSSDASSIIDSSVFIDCSI